MKFCTNCGAQLSDGTKFCTECGQKTQLTPPPAPAAAESPVQVYGQPVDHSFSAPTFTENEQGMVHTYGAPVSHSFTPPVQTESALSGTYSGAVPATAAMPVPEPEPVHVPEPEPVPAAPAYEPVRTAEPSAAPAEKPGYFTMPEDAEKKKANFPPMPTPGKGAKGGNKKIRLVLVGVLVLALVVGLFSCIGGGGNDDDPNLGLYHAISCSYGGFDMDAEGEWIELKSGGKLDMLLLNEEYSGKWELDGTELTVTQAGDTYLGTLEDGVITLDLGGLIYTYEKEGGAQPGIPADNNTDTSDDVIDAAVTEPVPSEVGSWTLKYSEGDPDMAMDEETVQMLKSMGIEITVVINSDGTGTFTMDEPFAVTVSDGSLVAEDGSAVPYVLEGDELVLTIEGAQMHFVRAEAAVSSGKKGGPVTYVGVSGNVNGALLNDSAMLQLGNVTVSFNGDGTGTMDIMGQAGDITYDDTTITKDGLSMSYTMDGDAMHLKMSDSVSFVLMPRYAATDYSREDLTVNDLGYWDGDYYGWWCFDNVIYGDAPQGNWWDCCMTLDVYPDGTGHILIWDEDYGKEDPIARVDISISIQAGVARIVSEGGQFLGTDVKHADWLFYSDSTDYENTLGFSALYEDDNYKIDCYFFLRQWGTTWEDVEADDPNNMPGYYEDWYLPLIKSGVTTAPDTIG